MGNRAHSVNRKGLMKNAKREEKLEEAVKAHTRLKASSDPVNVAKLAREFDVDYTSLWRWVKSNSQPSKTESLGKRQKLSPSKEKQLLELILEFSSRDIPMRRDDIREYATHMANSRKQRGPKITFGKNWVGNFIDRHHRVLSTHWSHPLDSQWTSALTLQAVQRHFQCVKAMEEKYKIVPENDYGMDESNIISGFSRKQRVVGRRGAKQQNSQRDGARDSYTVVETICADGTVLKPMVIYKAKIFLKEWGMPENNTIGAQ